MGIKASSAVPILYRNVLEVDNKMAIDGGIANPIPVEEAYKRGAQKIMVIRSRPANYYMDVKKNLFFMKLMLRKYPAMIYALKNRAKKYNKSVDFIRHPTKGIKIIEIAPPDDFQTKRLTKDIDVGKTDYDKEKKIGEKTILKWNNKELIIYKT